MIGIELRKRIVEAYTSGLCGSYEKAAELFGVGRATVSRLLRRRRETGDIKALAVGGNRARQVDLGWLREHAQKQPDARLVDRVEAWQAVSGRRVALSTMCNAMRAIGWTHKKKRLSPTSRAEQTWSPNGTPSSSCSRS